MQFKTRLTTPPFTLSSRCPTPEATPSEVVAGDSDYNVEKAAGTRGRDRQGKTVLDVFVPQRRLPIMLVYGSFVGYGRTVALSQPSSDTEGTTGTHTTFET